MSYVSVRWSYPLKDHIVCKNIVINLCQEKMMSTTCEIKFNILFTLF